MNGVGDLLRIRQYLTEEFHLAGAQCAAAALIAEPAQVEADQLPHGVQAEAAGHDRVAFEMALEEPQVWMDIELGNDLALAEAAASVADVGDAIDHQDRKSTRLNSSHVRISYAVFCL